MLVASRPASEAAQTLEWDRLQRRKNFARIGDVTTILFVLVWLCTPAIIGFVKPAGDIDKGENRRLAQWPALPMSVAELPAFPKAVSEYLRDHVGLRSAAATANARALFLVGDSAKSDTIFGDDGFLFLRTVNVRNDLVEAALGRRLLSSQVVERIGDRWQATATEAARRNLPYLIVFVPNKKVVHRDKIPPIADSISDRRILSQLEGVAAARGVPFLNLTSELLTGRQTSLVWYKWDTHWDGYGALLGYNRIAREIEKQFGLSIAPIEPDDWALRKRKRIMDIARKMGLGEMAYVESDQPALLAPSKAVRKVIAPNVAYYEMDNPGKPVLLITHDSFLWSILPYLQQRFSKIISIKNSEQKIPWDLVDRFKPNILMSLNVEKSQLFFQQNPGSLSD